MKYGRSYLSFIDEARQLGCMPRLAGAVMCRTHGIPAEAGAESGVVCQLLFSFTPFQANLPSMKKIDFITPQIPFARKQGDLSSSCEAR